MIMEHLHTGTSKDANGQIDLTKPMSGWFKPTQKEKEKEKEKESNSQQINVIGGTTDTKPGVGDKTKSGGDKTKSGGIKTTSVGDRTKSGVGDKTTSGVVDKTTSVATAGSSLCRSIIGCASLRMKGYEYCHKHILEDKSSPFRRCSFITKSDYKRCRNPTPIRGEKRAYCTLHEKERKQRADGSISKNNKKKKKHTASPHRKPNNKKRPSTLPVPVTSGGSSGGGGGQTKKQSSSDEEEFSFFTDTVQVNKTDCLWLGNQASDAESTDSEDENVLNHAGVWTVEECIRILKEKLERIRYLYALQYKRLNYCLKEERRKMLAEYDMDPITLSKVGFEGCPESPFEKFVEGAHLTNYQKLTGPELICERQWKDKRSKGTALHSRKADLPRCTMSIDGQRCNNKLLPLTKYCHTHICHDPEQYLFSTCTFKYTDGKKCVEPTSNTTLLSSSCRLHQSLSVDEKYRKTMELFMSAKQRSENRKRRMLGKVEKKEGRAKRSSTRLKEGGTHAHSISEDCNNSSATNTKTSASSSSSKSNNKEKKDGFLQQPEEPKDIQKEGNIFEKGLFQTAHAQISNAKSFEQPNRMFEHSNVESNVVSNASMKGGTGSGSILLGDNGILPTIVEGK